MTISSYMLCYNLLILDMWIVDNQRKKEGGRNLLLLLFFVSKLSRNV